MTAGQPWVLIDHCGKPFGSLRIGPLPQCAEGPAGRNDRQIIDAVGGGDFGKLVRHARAASDAGHHSLGSLQDAVQHPLRAAHLPQYVDVDRALAAGDFIGALHLRNRAVDGIIDQFLMAFAAGQRLVDLRNDPPFGIIAVGIDRRYRADAAGRRPGAGAGMVGGGNALPSFDQRPNFAATVQDGLQAFEQRSLPNWFALL